MMVENKAADRSQESIEGDSAKQQELHSLGDIIIVGGSNITINNGKIIKYSRGRKATERVQRIFSYLLSNSGEEKNRTAIESMRC